jgi:hypothetical protein
LAASASTTNDEEGLSPLAITFIVLIAVSLLVVLVTFHKIAARNKAAADNVRQVDAGLSALRADGSGQRTSTAATTTNAAASGVDATYDVLAPDGTLLGRASTTPTRVSIVNGAAHFAPGASPGTNSPSLAWAASSDPPANNNSTGSGRGSVQVVRSSRPSIQTPGATQIGTSGSDGTLVLIPVRAMHYLLELSKLS